LTATAVANPHICDRQALIDVRTALIEPLGIFASTRDASEDPAPGDEDSKDGVVVSARVETGRPQVIPLERGDVIRSVNGTSVATPGALREAVERVPLRSAVVLQVEHDGRLGYVAFERD
jgi:S1-C subfamily serine protease